MNPSILARPVSVRRFSNVARLACGQTGLRTAQAVISAKGCNPQQSNRRSPVRYRVGALTRYSRQLDSTPFGHGTGSSHSGTSPAAACCASERAGGFAIS